MVPENSERLAHVHADASSPNPIVDDLDQGTCLSQRHQSCVVLRERNKRAPQVESQVDGGRHLLGAIRPMIHGGHGLLQVGGGVAVATRSA